jgi:hypothetical protein
VSLCDFLSTLSLPSLRVTVISAITSDECHSCRSSTNPHFLLRPLVLPTATFYTRG